MVEALVGLLVVVLSLVAHYLKFKFSKEGLQSQEDRDIEKELQALREAMAKDNPDGIAAILAAQSDRVQQTLRRD